MGIAYDPRTLSWSVTPEKADYRTNYPTNYQTDRRTDNPTNLPSNTSLPSFLPTNLRYDYPTTLRTDFKTDYNERTEYVTRVSVGTVSNKQGTKTSYTFGTGNREIRFVPVEGDTYTYRYISGSGKYGTTYATATIDGDKATLAKALEAAGFAPQKAAEYALANAQGVRNVRDENDGNVQRNIENRQKNNDNARKNEENRALNDRNFNENMRNADKNIRIEQERSTIQQQNTQNAQTNASNIQINNTNLKLNDEGRKLNEQNTTLNKENTNLNFANTVKNDVYNKTLQISSSTFGGDYVNQRDKIALDQNTINQLKQAGVSDQEIKETLDYVQSQFKAFYQTEKLQRWDPNLGSQPPYGVFDPNYYKEQNPTVAQAYLDAQAIDDIDITERYGEEGYYLQHYTHIGKNQGLRANKEEDTTAANRYLEEALTDKELQDIRDYQLGVDRESISERLFNIPEVTNEWAKAKLGDSYWKNLAKENYLDLNNPDDFSVLFRLSERPQDKQIIFNSNLTDGKGITQLEDAINQAIGAKAEIDVKKFAALNQSILKDTIKQLKKVQGEQEMLSFYRGFSGFSEVLDINKELSNQILGDSGIGGILSFTSGEKAEKSLLGSLENITGMRNSVTYNWEKWFDQEIKNKYGIDYGKFEPLEEKKDIISAFVNPSLKEKPFDSTTGKFSEEFLKKSGFKSSEDLITFLGQQGEEGDFILNTIKAEQNEESKQKLLPINARIKADIKLLEETQERAIKLDYKAGDISQVMNIEAQFARDYIDEYLLPRFNTSRSMNEFIDYLDVQEGEQNPFQTQDSYNAVSSLAQLYGKKYLDDLKQEGARGFDPSFYFNPTGDISREKLYQEQKQTVEDDWEKAKAGDAYWNSQAYRFGVDINDKDSFARMHFEVKGQGKGFDGASDIVNATKVQNYLYETVIPALKRELSKQDPVFGQFITPEEFANEMVRGLDPQATPDEWKKALDKYGLEDFTGSADEFKDYIEEILRTGSAQEIREQIKSLNEKREELTQEKLGTSYIQREEDKIFDAKQESKDSKSTTELYSIFKNAGYQGTEDEFYENMFPDIDRSEQVTITRLSKEDPLKEIDFGFNLKDPFSSLETIQGFFPEEEEQPEEEEDLFAPYSAYNKLNKAPDYESLFGSTKKTNKNFLDDFTSSFGLL